MQFSREIFIDVFSYLPRDALDVLQLCCRMFAAFVAAFPCDRPTRIVDSFDICYDPRYSTYSVVITRPAGYERYS